MHEYHSCGLSGATSVSLVRLFPHACNDEIPALLHFQHIVSLRKDEFDLFAAMFAYPSFFREILSFARELSSLQLNAKALPADNPREKQLRTLTAIALECLGAEENTEDPLLTVLQDQDLVLTPQMPPSLAHSLYLEKMKESGMATLPLPEKPLAVKLRHASSLRREIEAVAQDIVRNDEDCNVILASPIKQLPIVKQVFERYHIPFACVIDTVKVQLNAIFCAAARFALQPDAEHLLALISRNAFSSELSDEAYAWLLKVLKDDLSYQPIAERYEKSMAEASGRKDDSVKRNDDVLYIARMDKECMQWFDACADEFHALITDDPVTALKNGYALIRNSRLLSDRNEQKCGYEITEILRSVLSEIKSPEDVEFVLQLMEKETVSSFSYTTDFCTVTDLRHPVTARKRTYVLGCSGRNYPGFSAQEGIFSEALLKRVNGYPSLQDRQNLYMSELSWLEHSCTDELVYSYYTNEYSGRQVLPAFEVSVQAEDMPWIFIENDHYSFDEAKLKPETLKDLFYRKDADGEYVSGSVSSIEAWFSCPYRGFLSSGLYVRNIQMPSLDAATIGTLQHAVMEKAMIEHHENYAQSLTRDSIRKAIRPCFDALILCDPGHETMLRFSEDRLVEGIYASSDILRQFSGSTKLRPYRPEAEFKRYPVSDHVRLNGTVDRVDLDPETGLMAIIDYKSSAKALSPSKVTEGLQLQLLSYLLAVLDGVTGLDPEKLVPGGAYYFSMQDTMAEHTSAFKVNRRSFAAAQANARNEETVSADYVHERSLSGWTFTENGNLLDGSGELISSLNKVYDVAEIRSCMKEIYNYFSDMLAGNAEAVMAEDRKSPEGIEIAPVEGACTFCDYKGICRFHGEVRKPAPIAGKLSAHTVGKEKKK